MPRKYLDGYAPSKPFCVYVITCTLNGKQYVGKAADAWKRWNQHRSEGWRRKKQTALYRAMRKYGVPNFGVEVLAEYDTEREAFDAERAAVAALGTKVPNGYNLTDGGEGCSGGPGAGPWSTEALARNRTEEAVLARSVKRWANKGSARCFSRAASLAPSEDRCFACRQPRSLFRLCLLRSAHQQLLRVAVAMLAVRAERPVFDRAEQLRRLNVQKSSQYIERDQQIVTAYRAGASMATLAARFKTGDRHVRTILRRANVEVRVPNRTNRAPCPEPTSSLRRHHRCRQCGNAGHNARTCLAARAA